MRTVWILLAVASASGLAACGDGSAGSAGASTSPASASAPAWEYSEVIAPLQDKPAKLACIESSNQVSIGTWGLTTARLCLRQGPGYGSDAYIALEDKRGQFVCDIEDCNVPARFDGGATQRFSATDESTDYQDNTLFFRGAPRLYASLKKASDATFAVTTFESGAQALTFHTKGLEWSGGAPSGRRRR